MGSKVCVKFQRASLKFHTKFWTHTPQNRHFTVFYFCAWVTISLNCDVISPSETDRRSPKNKFDDLWIYVTRQRVNSLWHSDAIWGHRAGSTLTQVMACCLTASIHYLNQCWLNIRSLVTITSRQFHKRCLSHQSLNLDSNFLPTIPFKSLRANALTWKIMCHATLVVIVKATLPEPDLVVNYITLIKAIGGKHCCPCMVGKAIYSLQHRVCKFLTHPN